MCLEKMSTVCRKAVLFDLDDTLYPEHTYVACGFFAVAKYLEEICCLKASEVYKRLLAAFFNDGIRGNTFDLVLKTMGVHPSQSLVSRLVDVYRAHDPDITLYPDARRILLLLRPHFQLGVLTDGYTEVQRRKVQALGIESFFDVIIYSDDFGRAHWKPSVIPFQYFLNFLKIRPENTVYVGDNPYKDFIGARKIGINTVRLRKAHTEHGQVLPARGFEADYEITTLDDLVQPLQKIFDNLLRSSE